MVVLVIDNESDLRRTLLGVLGAVQQAYWCRPQAIARGVRFLTMPRRDCCALFLEPPPTVATCICRTGADKRNRSHNGYFMKHIVQGGRMRRTATPAYRRGLVALAMLALAMLQPALGADARLTWGTINDPRSITYELHYGEAGQPPDQQVSSETSSAAVSDLTEGRSYAFAVRACVTDSPLCSTFSPQLIATVPSLPAAPEAAFSASTRSGEAPLSLVFTDTSSGMIDSRQWTLGDGATATGERVEHRYVQPGTYSVALTVSGPGGSDTLTRSNYIVVSPPEPEPGPEAGSLEAGEVQLNSDWQWIAFQQAWADPVVVARPLSGADEEPALVRIDGVTSDGFWARIQEWDYLDDSHVDETLGWMVMNAGTLQTDDGRWIEAGRISTSRPPGFLRQSFTAPFGEPPMVLSAVTSNLDPAPVISRIRNVDATGFQIGMREEEAADQTHGLETLSYIAIEPGTGTIGDLWAEVGITPNAVRHTSYTVAYQSAFTEPPILLAQMQTTNGGDTANLRWTFRTNTAVDLWVAEEQSRDVETRHINERVGYLLLASTGNDVPDQPEPGITYEDAEDGTTLGWRVYTGSRGETISNETDADVDGRVIVLSGAGWNSGYHLQRDDNSPWADSEHAILEWDLKYAEAFHVYVDIETSRGQMYLEYTPVDESSTWVWREYVHHGLGTALTDGRWHHFERDLAADLADGYPDAQLERVNGFLIRGSGRVDNIRMR
ncbi:hypothetical protein CKO42_15720 [Lamprobacter modestohalophilus]|uniref:PKD domain-containing protein n=2 Tax=Lamprobacter modestohalophilus TaxID=1064514 RepID=A0A9X0WAJ8_9GAMM|nr:hypothetical protein [Lamprobacter modestohalophilus]